MPQTLQDMTDTILTDMDRDPETPRVTIPHLYDSLDVPQTLTVWRDSDGDTVLQIWDPAIGVQHLWLTPEHRAALLTALQAH